MSCSRTHFISFIVPATQPRLAINAFPQTTERPATIFHPSIEYSNFSLLPTHQFILQLPNPRQQTIMMLLFAHQAICLALVALFQSSHNFSRFVSRCLCLGRGHGLCIRDVCVRRSGPWRGLPCADVIAFGRHCWRGCVRTSDVTSIGMLWVECGVSPICDVSMSGMSFLR